MIRAASALTSAQIQQLIASAGFVTPSQLAAATSGMASQAAVSAVAAAIPVPATAMPPGVADDGSVGSASPYARGDHTHASKARKSRVAVSAATYTWTYPTPFANGVVPICIGMAEKAGADLFNVQLDGPPTNTTATFRINRVSAGLLSLLLGALSINPTPAAITLHLVALEP